MPSLNKVARAFGTTRDAFNSWERGGLIRTPIAATMPGVARPLSRQNVLEIGFLAAFTRCGVSPVIAVLYVESLVRSDRHGAGTVRKFLVIPAGVREPGKALALDELDPDALQRRFGDEVAYTIICTGEIVRRADQLMEA